MKHLFFQVRYILFFVVSLLIFNISSAQKKTKVEILNASFFRSDKDIAGGARRLIGNVKFRQDNTIMKCDSAYFYSQKNMFDAFGNVHLYKQDDNTVDVKSDFLRHNGNTKMAHFRDNVVLRDTQIVLYTDSLDYDIRQDIGYYKNNATIVDSATTLTSVKGYYYNKNSEVFFKKNVVVVHNQGEYELYTDTLKYNTQTDITHFLGPTEFYNDTNYMYAEFGWYNTENNRALFKQNAIYTNPNQSITADSLFYDKDKEFGIAYSNVVATDTTENIIITGNYLEVYNNPEKVLVTDSALIIHIIDGDSVFMHADTIITEFDTSENRTFKAFHHMRIFKSSFQIQADSLFFTMADSILQLHGSPVMWAEESQVTANYIEAFIVNEKLDRFKLYGGGLIVSQEDTSHFNQIKGVEMTGYLRDNQLHKIDVFKKSETIYFPVDEYGIIGANKSKSKNITIWLKENKINRIIYRDTYEGGMLPVEDLTPKDITVRGFEWLEDYRPKVPADVFLWNESSSIDLEKNNRVVDGVSSPSGNK